MKLIKKTKKGFTLVELVVVIAIIAILSGVSVAVYVSVTNKAKQTADSEIISQLNLQMKAQEVYGRNITCMDAYEDAFDIGFDLAKMHPQYGDHYVWDEANDRFAVMKGNEVVAQDTDGGIGKTPNYKRWIFVENPSSTETRSQFLVDEYYNDSVSVISGFDAGLSEKLPSVAYTNANAEQEVIIRLNSAETVLGIEDAGKAVTLFGEVGKIVGVTNKQVDADKGATVANNSLHIDEEAKVAYLKVAAGHVENKGTVDLVYAISTNVTITNTGDIDHAHTISSSAAGTLNTASTGVTFDFNENTQQNDNPEVYHHVAEGTSVAGDKPVTGTDTWSTPEKVESSAESIVDQASGKIVTVLQGTNTVTKWTLEEFRNQWNEGEFYDDFVSATLTGDADITEANWYPIGTWEYPFHGTFDGGKKTIDGLTARSTDADHKGLYANGVSVGFGEVYGFIGIVGGGNTTVKDVTFTNVNIDIYNGKDVGTVIGYIPSESKFIAANKSGADKFLPIDKWTAGCGVADIDVTFSSVIVGQQSSDEHSSINGKAHVGGLIGKAYNSGNLALTGCTNYAAVTSQGDYCAGLVAYASSGILSVTFTNCYNKANVTSPNYVGGLVNTSTGKDYVVSFVSCGNTGTLTGNLCGQFLGLIQNSFVQFTSCESFDASTFWPGNNGGCSFSYQVDGGDVHHFTGTVWTD